MATLDQGVANLERFIGLLVSATSATGAVGEHVKEASGRFSELAEDAQEEGGGLNDHLTELGSTLETDEAEVVAAINEIAQGATEAQQTAGDVREKVEQAATDLEQKADTLENGLEQAATQLTSEGFQAMVQALDEAQQALETESQEEAQAFTELETAVGGFETDAEAAWNEAEAELEEAATALAEGETNIESESSEGVQEFGTAGTELASACTALESEVDVIYDALDQGVEAQGQAWQQAVQAAAQDDHTFVSEGQRVRVDQPAAMVEDEALTPLNQEYETLSTVLDAAVSAVSQLEPLAEDLIKSQVVVGQVDDLMKALAS